MLEKVRNPFVGYAAAVAFVALAIALRWALDPWLGPIAPLATIYGAVVLAVWVGGLGPALLATLTGYLAVDWLFIEPRGTFSIATAYGAATFAIYALSCGFIIAFGVGMRRAHHRADAEGRRAAATLRHGARSQELLVAVHDRTRGSSDPQEVMATIAECVGRHFAVSRCLYADVDAAGQQVTIFRDYVDGVPSVAGRHRMGAFSAALTEGYRRGETVVIADVREDERTHAAEALAALERVGIRSLVGVPLVKEGRLAGIFGLHHAAPRSWSKEEVALVEQVADRTWFAVEHARSQAALRESEERFRNMADHAPVMVWVTAADGACTFVSQSWLAFTGQPLAGALGFGWIDAVHPDDRASARGAFEAANAKREPFRSEYRLRDAAGAWHWALNAAAPRFGEDGAYLGFVGSVIDITEHKVAEDALRETDRRKDEFLATLAHELRNPLAPIRNAIEIMRLRDVAPELRGPRDIIDRQVRNLTRLVDDLLEVSRITQGKLALRREPVDLAEAVNEALEGARPLIAAAAHEVTVSLQPSLQLFADGTRVTQMILNLLNNAAKYTPTGGHIWIGAAKDGADIAISVRDNGIGIDPDHLPHLFKMFSQVTPALDRAHGGLGIGLALVQGLAQLHGGSVRAYSAGPGRGSEFVLRLPAAQARRPLLETATSR
jgi:PAS domain S-box-containing protein